MSRMDLYRNYYCSSSNTTGQYCLVEFMEYMDDPTTVLDLVLQCRTDEEKFCSPPCMEALEDFRNELGCCAVNLLNTSQTQFPYDDAFERCGLSLKTADICSGAQQKNFINLLLLVVATSLSFS